MTLSAVNIGFNSPSSTILISSMSGLQQTCLLLSVPSFDLYVTLPHAPNNVYTEQFPHLPILDAQVLDGNKYLPTVHFLIYYA